MQRRNVDRNGDIAETAPRPEGCRTAGLFGDLRPDFADKAGRFGHQMAAFNAAPSVYTTRSKLETFVETTRGARKYILSNPDNRDIINLELQDKLRSDLLDVTVDPDN